MECHKLVEIDVSKWNTNKVEDFSFMFNGCLSLVKLDLSSFYINRDTSVFRFAMDCPSLITIKAPQTQEDTTLGYTFADGCSSLIKKDIMVYETSFEEDSWN